MAQIVTITNPLTGQPAQVDQLEHTAQQIDDAIARALPGGGIDTLLSGKAPAGYGLGMNSNTSIYDADNITAFGFYTAKTNTPTNDWCAILNIPYGQNRATQFSTLGEAVSDDKYSYCKREKIGGIWKPWEWVNPRMSFGVEYRTTERYLGKPVYVKAISFGKLPNKGVASVSDDFRGTNIVSVCGITSSGDYFPYYSGHTSSVGRIDIYANIYGNIWVTTTTDKSGETAMIIVKYTKN